MNALNAYIAAKGRMVRSPRFPKAALTLKVSKSRKQAAPLAF
ncbi:hypothetical protein [Chlorobaculum sp. 24CR]|nr:hypothetical protein [Chlorobaculum sp. 24CR]